MTLLKIFLAQGIFCFMFLWGAEIILREKFITNFIFICDLDELEEQIARDMTPPFDGFFRTFVLCLIPVFNWTYAGFYLFIALTKDEERLCYMRETMRETRGR
jgi:hypothetical protein